MEIIYLKSFFNDIKKVKDKTTKNKIKKLIEEIKLAKSIEEVSSIKKLKGYSVAFRARMGDYRVGMYKEQESIELARFVKRNDIYKVFPKKETK